jgi:hypothetical protein
LANVPLGQSATLTSSDDLVSVTFPAGTFNTAAYCAIEPGNGNTIPSVSGKVLGPYSLYCTDSNGDVLTTFNKTVTAQFNLPSSSTKYVGYTNTSTWKKVPSTQKVRTLSFKLTKAETFAAASTKSRDWASIIFNVVGLVVIVFLIGGVVAFVRHRNSQYQGYGD